MRFPLGRIELLDTVDAMFDIIFGLKKIGGLFLVILFGIPPVKKLHGLVLTFILFFGNGVLGAVKNAILFGSSFADADVWHRDALGQVAILGVLFLLGWFDCRGAEHVSLQRLYFHPTLRQSVVLFKVKCDLLSEGGLDWWH